VRAPPAALLVALGFAALWARLPGADRGLSYDELFTLTRFATSPAAAMGEQVAANNHPLASLLAWAASALGARSELALRAPFLLLGALVAPALAAGTARALGWRSGLLAGALVALAPPAALAAQQVRGYAGVLLAGALLPGLVAATLRRPTRGRAAGLAAAVGLGALSHATLLLAAAGAAAAVAVGGRADPAGRRSALAGLGGGAALAALGYAPTAGRLLKWVRSHAFGGGDAGADGLLGPGDALAALGGAGPLGVALGLAALGLAGAGAAALAGDARRGGAVACRALVGHAGPLLGAAALLALAPPAYPRFLWFALPAALALAGHGLARLGRRRGAALGLAPLALACAVGLARQAPQEVLDLRGAARLARASAGAQGLVLVAPGSAGPLVAVYDPGIVVAPLEDAGLARLLEEAGPLGYVDPFPAWTSPTRRALLWEACGPPRVLPGRDGPVVVYAR